MFTLCSKVSATDKSCGKEQAGNCSRGRIVGENVCVIGQPIDLCAFAFPGWNTYTRMAINVGGSNFCNLFVLISKSITDVCEDIEIDGNCSFRTCLV